MAPQKGPRFPSLQSLSTKVDKFIKSKKLTARPRGAGRLRKTPSGVFLWWFEPGGIMTSHGWGYSTPAGVGGPRPLNYGRSLGILAMEGGE